MYFTTGIASVVSRILTGKLCDTGWIARIHIFQIGAVLFGIADCLLPMVTSFKYLIVYSVTYGICEGMIMTSMNCIILSSFPGMGFGWYYLSVGFGCFIGPVAAGKYLCFFVSFR
jgi:MFS family permease